MTNDDNTGQQNVKFSVRLENHMAGLKEQFILNKNSFITRAIMVEFRKKSTETF